MIEIGAGGSKLGGNSKEFLFDACFSPKAIERDVFMHLVQPLVDVCLDGYNATCLAYGQTGSGKTYTILGPSAESGFDDDTVVSTRSTLTTGSTSASTKSANAPHSQAGIIPRALRDLFHKLETIKANNTTNDKNTNNDTNNSPYEYEVRVQFLELYGEEIRDLLSTTTSNRRSATTSSSTSFSSLSNKLVIRDGVSHNHEPEVVGAMEIKVNNAADALLCLTRGMLRRVTGATAMNAESSRSHAIMTVIVEQTIYNRNGTGTGNDSIAGASTGGGNANNNSNSGNNQDFESKRSKFHFVDLAGSERQKRSQAEGIRLKEGIDINKGLLVLGNVISALGDPKKKGKAFVPYRDSKLTRLLKGSLGGNHKTLMIACVSPSSLNMEESLNCLRYANRAKNIQNNAIINVDAGTKLVMELRGQVQALATELLSVQENDSDDGRGKRFSNDVLRKMANGNDTSNMKLGSRKDGAGGNGSANANIGTNNRINTSNSSPSRLKGRENRQLNTEKAFLDVSKAEISILKQTVQELRSELVSKAEELFAAKAEVQYYRLRLNMDDTDVNTDGDNKTEEEKVKKEEEENEIQPKSVFVNQVTEYEREIAKLKNELREVKATVTSYPSYINDGNDKETSSLVLNEEQNLTPENHNSNSKRLKSKNQRRARRAAEALEKESKDEQKEIDRMARKYINLSDKSIDEDDEDNNPHSTLDTAAEAEESFVNRQAHLGAHVMELSKGISAKEELIVQLKESQTKYATMRTFYQDKLRKMTMQLRDHILEKNNLEIELKKYAQDSEKYKDLLAALKAKEKHIDHLRSRQSEIESLTSIASRNESVIEKLKGEITNMKQTKVELQKRLMKERKDHDRSLKQLKKQASSHERDANKAKVNLAKTMAQKQKVQDIAKSHAEEISKLRSKYREAEKKLRMQTLKRGVMERAGIDPVLVGRKVKAGRPNSHSKPRSPPSIKDKRECTAGDIQHMRSFLDDKVAEISSKEAAADKLAIEWEDHLELTTRKDQIALEANGEKDSLLSDELEALDFQIQYKESRIRQLARRLSSGPNKPVNSRDNSHYLQDILTDDRKFKDITSEFSAVAAAQLSSKVLFGMVVRERRRVAKLARTASSLDQKKLDAENIASSKEAALRSHMEESKNERVAMAQNHQEKILSLMSLLHQDQEGQEEGKSSPERHESVILALANERIDALEKQLEEMQTEKISTQVLQAREDETVEELSKLTDEHGRVLDQSAQLRLSLSNVRKRLVSKESDFSLPDSKDKVDILKLIDNALKESTTSQNGEGPIKQSPSSLNRRSTGLMQSTIYETESEDEDGPTDDSQVPEWAGHIMEDLAIIAEGNVPPSLKKPKSHKPPIRATGSVFDRLSNVDNYTGSQRNIPDRFNDDASVGSTFSSRSTVRKDRASLMRVQSNGQTNNTIITTPVRSRSRSNTPVRKVSNSSTPTPFRHTTPGTPGSVKSSRGRLTERITGILKDNHGGIGPPKELSIPNKDGKSIFGNDEKRFISAYTKKDVFERLQKKMTNSYALAQKAVIAEDEERNNPV